VPATLAAADNAAVTIGVKFQAERNGTISAIRYYKATTNTGTHVGNLWSATGQLLGTATFSNETSTGWQQALLDTPVTITANTTYVASYHAPVGQYSFNGGYFTADVVNSPLRALASSVPGGNGVYAYGATPTFPTQTNAGGNYWVDVVFLDPDINPPTVTSTTPATGAAGVSTSTSVSAVFSENLDPASVSSATFELRDGANALVTSTVSYAAATRTATLQPSGPLAEGVTYTARLIGGATGARITDLAGNALASTVTVTFTTIAPPDTAITAAPAATTTSTSASFTFTATPAAGATFQCSLDGAAYAACTSPANYTGLALGAHTFNVRAVHAVNGTDPTPATHAWTINMAPPDTTITASPAATTTSTSASFSFTATPATGATFECSLDGAAFSACTSPASYTGLALGSHTFNVRAVNAGGPDASPAAFAWTVEALAVPDTTITASPATTTTSTSASFSFTSTPAGATFECSLDTGGYAACTSPQAYSGLALGSHTFRVRAVNAAGTDATPATFTWTITAASTGLVASYGFEEGTGTTTADSSGTGNNGTVAGATWSTAGRFGNALSFNGTSSLVNVADSASLDLTSGMTVSAWVRPTSLSSWRTVVLKEIGGGLAYGLYAHNDSSRPSAWTRIGGAERGLDGTAALALNAWTHIAMTYDGANVRLFINGAQVASRAQTGAINTSTNPLRIGGNTIWGEYFNGLIDEVRIYNRALTAAEITTDMNTAVRP
jgi:hypothetical protein